MLNPIWKNRALLWVLPLDTKTGIQWTNNRTTGGVQATSPNYDPSVEDGWSVPQLWGWVWQVSNLKMLNQLYRLYRLLFWTLLAFPKWNLPNLHLAKLIPLRVKHRHSWSRIGCYHVGLDLLFGTCMWDGPCGGIIPFLKAGTWLSRKAVKPFSDVRLFRLGQGKPTDDKIGSWVHEPFRVWNGKCQAVEFCNMDAWNPALWRGLEMQSMFKPLLKIGVA